MNGKCTNCSSLAGLYYLTGGSGTWGYSGPFIDCRGCPYNYQAKLALLFALTCTGDNKCNAYFQISIDTPGSTNQLIIWRYGANDVGAQLTSWTVQFTTYNQYLNCGDPPFCTNLSLTELNLEAV
jgi:hypothetical protein